jgi:hypothetical protein
VTDQCARCGVSDPVPGSVYDAVRAERDRLAAEVKELRLQAVSDAGQALEREQALAAEVERLREAGDELEDAVSDAYIDDPDSYMHHWLRRWRDASASSRDDA